MREFIERIEAKRLELGLSNERFAELLGCDPATWSRARRGEIPRSESVILGAVRAFPDLAPFLPSALHAGKD